MLQQNRALAKITRVTLIVPMKSWHKQWKTFQRSNGDSSENPLARFNAAAVLSLPVPRSADHLRSPPQQAGIRFLDPYLENGAEAESNYSGETYRAMFHSHSSGVEFIQWRPLEKVTSEILNRPLPGSLIPTSMSAFFHFLGGAAEAIGVLFAFSTMLWPIAPCSLYEVDVSKTTSLISSSVTFMYWRCTSRPLCLYGENPALDACHLIWRTCTGQPLVD